MDAARVCWGNVRPPWVLFLVLLLQGLVLAELMSSADEASDLPEVRHLVAQPDFREVRLRWETDGSAIEPSGFLVHYCELEAWGAHRCKVKAVDGSGGREAIQGGPDGGRVRLFSSVVAGLRMDTNYTFEVRPAAPQGVNAKARGQTIAVATSGFSARATLCLPEASEVEVVTGPHFGGRVAAEGGGAGGVGGGSGGCWVDGDARSARAVYVLRVDHAACAGARNATTAATYVTVQESAHILTHSTRRFLVICSFQPDTLTVSAGIRLPVRDNEVENELEASGRADSGEVARVRSAMLPYTDADVDGTLRAQLEEGRGVRAARLLHHRQLVDDLEVDAKGAGYTLTGRSRWPLTLLLLLTGVGLVGCALAVWWFSPASCHRSPELADDRSSLSAYENLANSLRDSLSVASFPASSTISSRTVHCDMDSVFTIRLDVDGGAGGVSSTTNCSEIGTTSKSSGESCLSHEDSNQSEA